MPRSAPRVTPFTQPLRALGVKVWKWGGLGKARARCPPAALPFQLHPRILLTFYGQKRNIDRIRKVLSVRSVSITPFFVGILYVNPIAQKNRAVLRWAVPIISLSVDLFSNFVVD